MAIFGSESELCVKKTNAYDWVEDAVASYAVAIETLRERYFEKRQPGESAKEWLVRCDAYKVDQ